MLTYIIERLNSYTSVTYSFTTGNGHNLFYAISFDNRYIRTYIYLVIIIIMTVELLQPARVAAVA